MTRSKIFAAAGLSLAFTVFGIFCLICEAAPFLRQQLQTSESLVQIDEMTYGYSAYSKYLTLDDCLRGMQAVSENPAVVQAKAHFDQECAAAATQIVSTMPTNSFAWLIKALAYAMQGDVGNFNDSLQQSHLNGPNEGWIAEWRLPIGQKLFFALDSQSAASQAQDIVILAGSDRGRKTLARLYLADRNLAKRIIPVMEKVPEAQQVQFFYDVKKAAKQG